MNVATRSDQLFLYQSLSLMVQAAYLSFMLCETLVDVALIFSCLPSTMVPDHLIEPVHLQYNLYIMYISLQCEKPDFSYPYKSFYATTMESINCPCPL